MKSTTVGHVWYKHILIVILVDGSWRYRELASQKVLTGKLRTGLSVESTQSQHRETAGALSMAMRSAFPSTANGPSENYRAAAGRGRLQGEVTVGHLGQAAGTEDAPIGSLDNDALVDPDEGQHAKPSSRAHRHWSDVHELSVPFLREASLGLPEHACCCWGVLTLRDIPCFSTSDRDGDNFADITGGGRVGR